MRSSLHAVSCLSMGEGISRQDGINLIMEHFGISHTAATRQWTRRILPALRENGMVEESTSNSCDEIIQQDKNNELLDDQNNKHQYEGKMMQKQPRQSIVISGVSSGLGRLLLQYYCTKGHDVAGCGWDHEEIQALQRQFPGASLSTVNVTDDNAVAQWASDLEGEGMEFDVVIANTEIYHETDCDVPAWEVPREHFDYTIDVNVKGVANMVRNFVPPMIRNHCTGLVGGNRGRGVFVAMSSGLGRSPNPQCAAHSASKFAIEGMMKSVAMSLPAPLCAIHLAPGSVVVMDEGHTSAGSGELLQQEKFSLYLKNNSDSDGVSYDAHRWVNVAGPMILRFTRQDNGRSMSIRGFHSVRDRLSLVIQVRTDYVFNYFKAFTL